MLLLALLPWWLGFPLLLALAVASLGWPFRGAAAAALIRRALRWGLPGVLFALWRALGADMRAGLVVLLGALAGYTLLAALEAWLDRELRRMPPAATTAEWPELALTTVGAAMEIIELQPPVWWADVAALGEPWLASALTYEHGGYRRADGGRIDQVEPELSVSPDGRWLVARMAADRGVVLWDRPGNRQHRLRGWRLAGWFHAEPWLCRRDDEMPRAWCTVPGEDRPD